jgi:GTP-binding protein
VPLPKVVIVGRPNVGKSSLFNRLLGRRLAVEDATPGVTRDRVGAAVAYEGRWVELYDTGGMGIQDSAGLTPQVEAQVRAALAEAAAAILVVDVRAGITGLDLAFARELRGGPVPVVVAANKADVDALGYDAAIFHKLGFGEPIPVSAREKRGLGALWEALLPRVPVATEPEAPALRVALVGARNSGKSTMVNALAGSERVIVSEVPGTTRDSVDVTIRKDGRAIVLVDTAGFAKRATVDGSFEFYSQSRSEEAIRRADVVCLILDSMKPIGKIQKQIAAAIVEARRPCVVVANKWDLVAGRMETGEFGTYVRRRLPNLHFAPIVVTTALTGKNALAMLDTAAMLWKQAQSRIPTGELNRLLSEAVERRATPIRFGKVGRIYFATQSGVTPPTVVCFVNFPPCFTDDYQRYLVNQLQAAGVFPEVPVQLRIRARRRERVPDDAGAALQPSHDLDDYADEPVEYELPLSDAGFDDEDGPPGPGPDAPPDADGGSP